MPPEVIDAMRAYRASLELQDTSQAVRLANLWHGIAGALVGEYEALAVEMTRRVALGLPVSIWHVRRIERYQSLMAQIVQRIDAFGPAAMADVTEMQRMYAALGLEHSQAMIAQQMGGVAIQFDRLPISAVLDMAGNTGAGTPLGRLLSTLPGEGAQAVTRALMRGTALGWNPSKTAQAMRQGAELAYQRALLIARTEQLRVYREASLRQYVASGVVEGYRRVASRSVRTCIGCLLTDGRFFEFDVPFEEHPAGRCTAIPVLIREDKPNWETGEQWFRGQNAAVQRQILGQGRYAAWQAGRFDLDATVTKMVDATWGNSYVPTPLSELVGV